MLNFIIYEDDEQFRDKYFSVIDKFIGASNLAYEIIELKDYSKEERRKLKKVSGRKIYILDIVVPGKSGLDFAKEIRESGDWQSQIIIVTSHEDLKNFDYQCSLLMLAFITKYYDLENHLFAAIKRAYDIVTIDDCIQFQKSGIVYQIPKRDVLYIEKEYNETLCYVVTAKDKILTSHTLIQWKNKLAKDPNFRKTHRNYIINMRNARVFDFDKNEISFENKKVALLSRNYKKDIKETLKRSAQENL